MPIMTLGRLARYINSLGFQLRSVIQRCESFATSAYAYKRTGPSTTYVMNMMVVVPRGANAKVYVDGMTDPILDASTGATIPFLAACNDAWCATARLARGRLVLGDNVTAWVIP